MEKIVQWSKHAHTEDYFETHPRHHISFVKYFQIQADLRNIVGSVPDHHDKANVAIKLVMWIFWFPSVYKSYVYTIL